jgi:hypothetical protein
MPDAIPLAILSSIARAVDTLRAWNTAITQARALEVVAHQPGRSPDAVRDTFAWKRLRARRDQALRTLDLFETRAQALGIPLEALYTACGGKPVLESEDAALQE